MQLFDGEITNERKIAHIYNMRARDNLVEYV